MSGISKRVSGSWVSGDYGIMKTATDIITTLPAVIYADGNNASVGLVGNMSQTDKPSPDNPIQPQETGERTENLFDEVYVSHTGSTVIYKPVYVGDGTFTLSSNIPQLQGTGQLFLLSGDVTSGASTGNNDVYNGLTRSVISTDGYVTIGYRQYSVSAPDVANYNVMLNTGSTPLPYEPYGVKIPISSGGVTTNIYLGSTQTVRAISKIVYNGSEDWRLHGSLANLFYLDDYQDGYADNTESGFAISNAFTQRAYIYVAGLSNGQFVYGTPSGSSMKRILMKNTACSTVEEWQTWLASNPVTVWYVLATPETATVNEPLRKIGDYADEVSGITIPTIAGANSFDVLTTLKPSEVTVNYKGWHPVSAVHERENGAWT